MQSNNTHLISDITGYIPCCRIPSYPLAISLSISTFNATYPWSCVRRRQKEGGGLKRKIRGTLTGNYLIIAVDATHVMVLRAVNLTGFKCSSERTNQNVIATTEWLSL